MENIFYINKIESREWYMLCVKRTHYCLAASDDVNALLRVVDSYAKTYKSAERVYSMLSGLSDKGKITPKTFAQREAYFKEHGNEYETLIEDILEKAAMWVENNKPTTKARNRLKRMKKSLIGAVNEPAHKSGVTNKRIKRKVHLIAT